jgi:hypothetical protein
VCSACKQERPSFLPSLFSPFHSGLMINRTPVLTALLLLTYIIPPSVTPFSLMLIFGYLLLEDKNRTFIILFLSTSWSPSVVYCLACLSLDLRFKPGRGRWIFKRAIKIRCTPFFGPEVKPSASCRKILRHVKEHYVYETDIS